MRLILKLLLRQSKKNSFDGYELVVNTANAGSASNTMILPFTGTTDAKIDWGDGSAITLVNTTSATHVYATPGTYTIRITGAAQLFFNGIGDNKKAIRIRSISKSIVSGSNMFLDCSLSGTTIPALPINLTDGNSMFASNLLIGNVPALPISLTNGNRMFIFNRLTGNVPALPINLTNGTSMFAFNLLTGSAPALPINLTTGNSMFIFNQLTGNVPALPISLTTGNSMFAGNNLQTYNNGSLANTRCVNWSQAFSSNAFNQQSIDNMLADLRSAVTSGFISASSLRFGCSGGTNAAPSAAGLVDKNYLISLGATISTN